MFSLKSQVEVQYTEKPDIFDFCNFQYHNQNGRTLVISRLPSTHFLNHDWWFWINHPLIHLPFIQTPQF